ncbi:MAG: hypothetical protein ABIH35_02100 [Patescibacteria group bacterium]
MQNFNTPRRLLFFAGGPERQAAENASESKDNLGNDFELKITPAAAKTIEIKNNAIFLKSNGKKIASLNSKTQSIEAALYIGEKGPNPHLVEIRIQDKDGSGQKVWVDWYGQLLFHEPKGGVIQSEDLTRLLGFGKKK